MIDATPFWPEQKAVWDAPAAFAPEQISESEKRFRMDVFDRGIKAVYNIIKMEPGKRPLWPSKPSLDDSD